MNSGADQDTVPKIVFASPRVKWEAQFRHRNVYCIWVLLEWDDATFLKLFTQGSAAIAPPTATGTQRQTVLPQLACEHKGRPQQRNKRFIRELTLKPVPPYLPHHLSLLPMCLSDTWSKYALSAMSISDCSSPAPVTHQVIPYYPVTSMS